MKTTQVTLASRPSGIPKLEDFGHAIVELPTPGDGELSVKVIYLSVDPYMRGRMNDAKSYVPPFRIGEAIAGGAVAKVLESGADGFAPGDLVVGMMKWAEFDVVQAKGVQKIDASQISPSAYLGILGMPGLTAYVGLLDLAQPVEGDVVFVSGAAGAVGSAAGQIAKIKGCTVIGSAGGHKKVERLLDLGFDAAIDYRSGNIVKLLAEAAPEGINVCFDNVGGDHLVAALEASQNYARLVLCGSISHYNDSAPTPGPSNLHRVTQRRLTLRGFIVSDHGVRMPEFYADMTAWVREGKIAYDETVLEGLDSAPKAFLGLFSGANMGKMVVRLDPS